MSNFSRLVDLYRGATLGSSLTKTLGQQAASASIESQLRRRQLLLSRAVRAGAVKPQSLSVADANLLGLGPVTGGGGRTLQQVQDHGADHHGVWGFFQNLGGDVVNFGKEFVPGLVQTGKAIVHDIEHKQDPFNSGGSQTMAKVIQPTLTGIGHDISNLYHGRWGEIYKHPLNPLLDVAAVGSLGAGGVARGAGALERAGLGDLSTSAGAVRRAVSGIERSPIALDGQAELQRTYSRRPFTKATQVGVDALTDLPVGDRLGLQKLAYKRASRLNLREKYAMMQLVKGDAIAHGIKPLEAAFTGLSTAESTALHLALRGANTPARLDAFQELMRRSLRGENPEGYNITDFGNVDMHHVQQLADLSPEIRHLAEHPTEQMHTAAEAWAAQVSRGHEVLDLPPEVHAEAVAKPQAALDEVTGLDQPVSREGQIDPNYAPDVSAENMKWHQPNALGKAIGQEEGFRIRRGGTTDREITRENLLTPTPQSYLHESSGELFSSGAFRTDKKVFLDHVSRRETDIVDQGYKRELINQYAAKGEDVKGRETTIKFKSQSEVDRKLGPGWKLVSESFPIQWYRHETDLLKEMRKSVDKLNEQGIIPGSPEFDAYLEKLSEADAKTFIRAHFGALKRPGVAVPEDFYQYQKSLTEAFRPLPGPLKYYQKFVNYWRTLTLTFMPRWAINTAVGTFLQSMVKGTFNPRDWLVADKLRPEMPPGVSLGHVGVSEDFGPQAMTLLERTTGAKVPTQRLAQGVQAIEDHFRRGMFVQSLRNEDKLRLADMGETVSSWYEKGMSNEDYIRHLIQDPELVHRAIKDTNKFAYNYAHLGPFERRYVRQIIPFWGWYKFITKLAWRLPFEYPGRARVMNMLSQVGLEAQDELGAIPDWLRGSIILNIHGKNLHYLSGMGLNPFSQFANPLDPHGSVNGLLQLGQLTPPLQALIAGAGLDPLTGQLTPISPEDPVATGLFGNIVDPQGREVAPNAVGAGWRILGTLLRSFPQARISEKYLDQGGGTPFSENVPIIHHRAPMAPARQGAMVGIPAALLSYTGLVPKPYDLGKFQTRTAANKALYNSAHKRQLERLRRRDSGQTP